MRLSVPIYLYAPVGLEAPTGVSSQGWAYRKVVLAQEQFGGISSVG